MYIVMISNGNNGSTLFQINGDRYYRDTNGDYHFMETVTEQETAYFKGILVEGVIDVGSGGEVNERL